MDLTIQKIKEEQAQYLLQDNTCRLEFIKNISVSQRKMLVCHLIKKPRMFNVYGYVELPNGKGSRDAEILSAEVPIYYLRVQEINISITGSKETGDRRVVRTKGDVGIFMCGATRHSTISAAGFIKKTRSAHLVHIENVLSDNGFPREHEFDEMFKAPIKRYARSVHKVPGEMLSNRSTVIVGVEDLGNKAE